MSLKRNNFRSYWCGITSMRAKISCLYMLYFSACTRRLILRASILCGHFRRKQRQKSFYLRMCWPQQPCWPCYPLPRALNYSGQGSGVTVITTYGTNFVQISRLAGFVDSYEFHLNSQKVWMTGFDWILSAVGSCNWAEKNVWKVYLSFKNNITTKSISWCRKTTWRINSLLRNMAFLSASLSNTLDQELTGTIAMAMYQSHLRDADEMGIDVLV